MARLFRALAEAETVHAMNHLKALQAVRSTAENLKGAIESEIAAFEERYPAMAATARKEGHRQAHQSFRWAGGAEGSHAHLLDKARKDPETGIGTALFVCGLCGYVVEGEPADNCPVCKAAPKYFHRVE